MIAAELSVVENSEVDTSIHTDNPMNHTVYLSLPKQLFVLHTDNYSNDILAFRHY